MFVGVWWSINRGPIFVRRVPGCYNREITWCPLLLQLLGWKTILKAHIVEETRVSVVNKMDLNSLNADSHGVETAWNHMFFIFNCYFIDQFTCPNWAPTIFSQSRSSSCYMLNWQVIKMAGQAKTPIQVGCRYVNSFTTVLQVLWG